MAYSELSKVYDKLIYEDIDYTSMKEFITNICIKYNVELNDYLDLACGTGNMTVELAKEFKKTFAVDLSDDMLREAQTKLRENKINSRLISQDMTSLELNQDFDLITCILDSTNYILEKEDLLNYFKGVYKHLKDNGVFVFDINSYYKLTQVLGNNIYTYDEDGIFYTWENTTEEDITSMFLTFFIKKENLYERFDEEHEERAYKTEEIEEVLKSAGLKCMAKYDGYSFKEISKYSERIVFVVTK